MNKAQRLLEQVNSINLGVSSKHIAMYDGGMFTSVAERLARDVGKVSYFVPWYGSDPKVTRSFIGSGLEGVEVTTDFWTVLGELGDQGLVFFPDAYQSDFMVHLSEEHNVLGSKKSSILELNKKEARDVCTSGGINMAKSEIITGLEALTEYLEKNPNKVVKPVEFRGEWETKTAKTLEQIKPNLDEFSLKQGPFANKFDFLVEDLVEGLECGVDGIVADGEYFNPLLFGFTSGYCYLAKALPLDQIPDPFKSTMDKLLRILKRYETRMFFGTEEIYDKKTSYLLDLTLRMANIHVSGIWTELLTNFSDVVYALGMGQTVEPSIKAQYVGSAVLVVSDNVNAWAEVKSPPDASEWLKLEYNSKDNGNYYIAPKGQNTVGAIIGIGDSWDEVIETIQERFEKVSCSIPFDPIPSTEEFMQVVEKVGEYGIEFK